MFKYIVTFCLLLMLCARPSHAQIAVADSQTAVQLVQKLTGTGVTITNATLVCSDSANGIFISTSSNLGLNEGIILSSGRADHAAGLASSFRSTSFNRPGDASLNALITPNQSRDVCKLEFDFVPIGDTVRFRYVFGSEEYTGFSCSGFNDVFGFFISGPGYVSPKNIALIPNTNIPVAINSTSGIPPTNPADTTICKAMGPGSPFSQYYVNNVGGTTVSYNGFTTVLTATAVVVPCSTYHLKLALGDAGDYSYDSGVFLEAGSFSSNILTVSTASNLQAPVPYCVRGCKNGQFSFKRQKVTSLPLTIKYQVSGTAVNGTDYTTIPDSVVIPANDSVATQTIVPLTTASGTKTVKLYIFSPFNCTATPTIFDSSTITIYDSIYAKITTADTNICPGASFTIKTVIDTNLTFKWSPVTWLSDTNSRTPLTTPLSGITYYLTATLPSSTCLPVHDNIIVGFLPTPNITSEPVNPSACLGTSTSVLLTAAGAGLTYQWQVKVGAAFANLASSATYSNVTTSSLGINNVTMGMNGTQYRCIVSGTCLPRDTSVVITLSVLTAPSVTTHPIDRTICEGETTSFTSAASGSNITYQWQVNTGSGFNAVSNNSIYSGATTGTLTITGTLYSMSSYVYRCVASGSCTPAANSVNATLTVYKKPEITTEPQNTAVCPDSPSSFNVTASATFITYQWQVNTGTGFTSLSNNSIYSGTATASLAIAASASSMHNYKYRCIVSGICSPPDTSAAATLTINTVPAFTAQPHDTTVCHGDNAKFTLQAVATALTYQWQLNTGSGYVDLVNNSTYSGVSSNSLLVASVPLSMAGYQYRCVISGTCLPRDTSDAVTLGVHTLPQVTLHPHDSTTCEGDGASFSVAATGTGITYQWQVFSGTSFINLAASSIYSGVNTPTLVLSTTTTAMSQLVYRCVVSGTCPPQAASSNAVLTVHTRPAISLQPKDSTVCDGQPVSFDLNAVATGIAYQWQVNTGSGFANIANGGIYSGATTNKLNISAATVGMNGYIYQCVVAGVCGPVATSTQVALTVNSLPDISMQPADSTICDGQGAAFIVAATATGINYQWQVNTGAGFTNIVNNAVYTGANGNALLIAQGNTGMNGYVYRCIVSGVCAPNDTSQQALLTVHALPNITSQPQDRTICDGANASFLVNATGTGISYQWQVNAGSGYINIVNSAQYAGATIDMLTVIQANTGMNNYLYRCVVSGVCEPADTSAVATLTVNILPDITSQPSDSTVCEGGDALFSISAVGTGAVYQWQVNNGSGFTNVSNTGVYTGATTGSLLITQAVAAMDNNLYRCIVTGVCAPDDTSLPGELTVHTLPNITLQPTDSIICDGQNASFVINATGTAITYQWQVNTGNGFSDITNNSTYSGAASNTLFVDNANTGFDNYLYRCIVTGICTPADTSVVAMLTVRTLPQITLHPRDTIICDGSNASFTISAVGTSLVYRWQVDDGGGFVDVSNNAVYSGAATSTLSITQGSLLLGDFVYRCIITGACTPADTSAIAKLTVLSLPDISLQPIDSTVCDGNDASFSISATGTSITYMWQVDDGSGFSNIANSTLYSGATTTTLSITQANVLMNSYMYRCIVAGACTPADTTLAAKLTVHALPNITMQPHDSTICEGGDASFSISTTGTAITYRWQVSDGTGFVDIGNGGVYAGVAGPSLNITTAPALMDGFLYRCIVAGVCTPPDTSVPVLFRVSTLPSITVTPYATQICEGGDAQFSLTATGTNLNYRWQVDDGNGYVDIVNNSLYSGANTGTLYITGVTTAMSGYLYQCIVSGDCPPAVTSGALTLMLTVFTLPSVTAQASDSRICEGGNTNFTISGSGTGISYQWQVDNGSGFANISNSAIYSGADTNSLDITGATQSMSGNKYRCIVKGVCLPDAISTSVTLTIDTLAAVLQQPEDTTVCEETPAVFTLQAAGTGRSYQWQVNEGAGFVNIANPAVYTGITSNTLGIPVVKQLMHGYQYRCIISALCLPRDTSDVVTLYTDTIPVITMQPHDSTICENDNAGFGITAIGTNISYMWQIDDGTGFSNIANSSLYSGATTPTLTVTNANVLMTNYSYRCIVFGKCFPPDTSVVAKLVVNTRPKITAPAKDSIICEGNNAAFSISATGTGITYQWQVNDGSGFVNITNNTVYSGTASNTLLVTAGTYAINGYLYRCIVTGTCPPPAVSLPVMLTVNTLPNITAQAKDSTICEGGNAAFAINATGTGISYQWQVNNGSGYVNVVNNTMYAGASTPVLNITAGIASMNDYLYRCIVAGTCTPPDTSAVAKLTVNTLPDVTVQPKDSAVCDGVNVLFGLKATGTGISYQWQVNNGSGYVNISNNTTYSGATADTLHITSPQFGMNNYKYRCVVSGICTPPDVSAEAILTIYTPPSITTQPANTIVCESDATTLSIVSSGSFLVYQWQVDTGTGYYNLANGATYTGVNTSTVTITAADTAMHGDKFRCIINGTCTPPDTSLVAALSVYTAPVITSQPVDSSACPGEDVAFTLQVVGSILTYQWQVNTGTGYSNVVNSTIYTGATTNHLLVKSITPSMNSYKYRCIVSGYCAPADTSDVVNLEVYPKPDADIIAGGATTFCKGESVILNGMPATGVTYEWHFNGIAIPGANAATYTAMDSGIYKLVIRNEHCYSFPDSVAITVNPLPDGRIEITGHAIICKDSFVILQVMNDSKDTYQWRLNNNDIPGANQYYYYASTQGAYELLSTNTYGCSIRSAPLYIEADITPDPFISTDNVLLCTSEFKSYQWYLDSRLLPGAAEKCYLARENGIYNVFATNTNGCGRWSNELTIDKVIEVWPNPTDAIINIISKNMVKLQLSDMEGKVIFTIPAISQVNIASVADGVYFLKLYDKYGDLIDSKRIVKKSR